MDNKELAEELRRWAVEEMRFRPQGRHIDAPLPSKDDFEMLCRGTMVDIWKYVLRHVKSSQTVEKIHGNLKLQELIHKQTVYHASEQDDGETEKLKAKHSLLTKELLELKNSVLHVEKEIRIIQAEILAAEERYDELNCQISDVAKRSALLVAYSKQCHHLADMFAGLAKQIDNKIMTYREIARKRSLEPTYYTSQGIISGSTRSFTAVEGRSTPSGLESACTRSVRESCERIGSFLHEVCKAEDAPGSAGDGSQRKIKDQLWTGVENILSQYLAQDILTSLSHIAQDSAISLRELSARIDLKRDAQELKFKYENSGKLTDMSSPPTILQSVHQLIEEGQAAHFQRFLESEKALNDSWKARQQLQRLQQELEAKLATSYQDSPGNLDLARVLHHNELELIASRASLEYIRSELIKLNNSRNERQRAKEILIMKHKKIKDFETLAQTKQSLIQALVKQNSNAKERLDKQQSELLQYIQQKICSYEAHVVAMAKQLQDSVTQEVGRFAALPLNQIQYSELDSAMRVPVAELSINRLKNLSSAPGGEAIRTVLNNLDFPAFKAPEELLINTVNMKEKVAGANTRLRSRDAALHQVDEDNSRDKVLDHLNGLRREVTQQDHAQMEYVMPLIQSGLSQATKALSDCITVKDIVSSWWEQPAQSVVPWVRLDDMNMRQWRDQWTVLSTRLRQLQMRH